MGSVSKNFSLGATLSETGQVLHYTESLIIAACFIPTAIIGGMFGAQLTHTLKLHWVRLALIILLSWASWQMLGLPELFGREAIAFP